MYIEKLNQTDIINFAKTIPFVNRNDIEVWYDMNSWCISIYVGGKNYCGKYRWSRQPLVYGLYDFTIENDKSNEPKDFADKFWDTVYRAWIAFLTKKFPDYQDDYNVYKNSFKL